MYCSPNHIQSSSAREIKLQVNEKGEQNMQQASSLEDYQARGTRLLVQSSTHFSQPNFASGKTLNLDSSEC